MFSYGEFKAEDQEKMLEALNHKVEAVYSGCIGGNEANIRLVKQLYPWSVCCVFLWLFIFLCKDKR